MKKKLIIGKNSWIVGNLKNLNNFDFISHKDLKFTNLNQYKWIFLFSWTNNSIENNLEIVKLIPAKKLIFISTIAVNSIKIRAQWNKYVLYKNIIENYILKNTEASILRLGIFIDKKKFHYGIIPYTSFNKLSDLLNNWNFKKEIIECIEICDTKNKKKNFVEFLNYLSTTCNNNIFLRKIVEIIIKFLFKSPRYGYTADLLSQYQESIQIGYGALGSRYYQKNKKSLLIVSDKEDEFLSDNGFKNTILGFKYIGLAKYWHGVYLKIDKDLIFKKIPLFVKRKKTPSMTIKSHIHEVSYNNGLFKISLKKNDNIINYFSKKLILSSGAIQNIKFLSQILHLRNKHYYFTDQEWHILGEINVLEAINKGYLKKNGPFLARGKLLNIKGKKILHSLIEFRPLLSNSSESFNINYFNDTTYNIFFKLIKKFSTDNINQAFFNKFGHGFYSNKILVIGQVEAKNSIKVAKYNQLYRTRISVRRITDLKKYLQSIFSTFKSFDGLISTDSQHISYESLPRKNKLFKKLSQKNILKILGTKTLQNEHKFYPTTKYINMVNKK